MVIRCLVVDRLDTAVGEPGIERIEEAWPVLLKRLVIVSTPRGGLVETNRGDGREVLLQRVTSKASIRRL